MKKFFLIIAILLPLLVTLIFADTEQSTSVVNMRINALCSLDITSANQTITLSGMALETAYTNGYVDGAVNNPTLTVCSNTSWRLTVQVTSTWNTVSSYHKSTSDLRLAVTSTAGHQTGFTSFTSLSTSAQQIALSSVGVDSENYFCQYRILLNRTRDVPGTYSCTLRYTLTTTA